MLRILTVLPCRPRWHDDHNWPGRFDASRGDRCLVERSRTPFCDGARALLAQGLADPGDQLVMRHSGSETDALVARVGTAAKLTVDENSPRLRHYNPTWATHFKAANPAAVEPPMREREEEASGSPAGKTHPASPPPAITGILAATFPTTAQ